MTFSFWPGLLGLFVPLAIAIWIWRRRGRRVVIPQDGGRMRAGRFWVGSINLMQTMPAIVLAAAILLAAGPRQLSVPQEKRALTNIEFCLDLSGSMLAKFGDGTRFDAAIVAISDFVDQREGDAFGLTLFAEKAVGWIPLTQDPSAFKCAAPFIHPRNMSRSIGGGTMIGLALRQSRQHLIAREEGDRMILLISDGDSFDLDDGQDEVIARELRADGIVVYGVYIGDGVMPAETASICTITGGASFSAGDRAGLKQVFDRIDAMKVVKMERTIADVVDWFWPFCIAGLSALAMFILSSFGLRFTPW
jgi:Ca-activated chloride channel homolog